MLREKEQSSYTYKGVSPKINCLILTDSISMLYFGLNIDLQIRNINVVFDTSYQQYYLCTK